MPDCTFVCENDWDCAAAVGLVHDDMYCDNWGEVCCEEGALPDCTYECVDWCDWGAGDITHDDMFCDGQTCCEAGVLTDCAYDCMPYMDCYDADGVVHDEMFCGGGWDVCCEPA